MDFLSSHILLLVSGSADGERDLGLEEEALQKSKNININISLALLIMLIIPYWRIATVMQHASMSGATKILGVIFTSLSQSA